MSIEILTGVDLDLISPFPISEIHRAIGWSHCIKTLIQTDDGPQTDQDYLEFYKSFFTMPTVTSFGMIDKNQKLNIRHEAPLIGFVAFERANLRNGYFHTATTRKAWGSGMIDEACKLILERVFTTMPELLRVSSFVINNNFPAKALARRMGFVQEGILQDSVLQNGEPKPVTHFGLTRRNWNNICQSYLSSPLSLVEPVLSLVP